MDQKESTIKKFFEIQDKAIRKISFKDKNYPTNELYCNKKIFKNTDYIKLLNCLFVKSILSNNHLPIFDLKLCSKKQVKLILIQLNMLPKHTWYFYHIP